MRLNLLERYSGKNSEMYSRRLTERTRALVATIDSLVGAHRRAVACGGWTRMESVRDVKRSAIAGLEFSTVAEPGVLGAAVLAAQAAGARTASPPS